MDGLDFSWDDDQKQRAGGQPGGADPQQLADLGAAPQGQPVANSQPAAGGQNLSDFAAHAGNGIQPSWDQPSGSSSLSSFAAPDGNRAGAGAGQQPTSSPYADLVSKLGATADPQQQAVLKDQLARNVFSTLKQAGHDVSWD